MTYSYPGEFENTTGATNFYTQVLGLGMEHHERSVKYSSCWDFYTGKQWQKIAPEGHSQITINYVAAFAKKLRRFTYRNDWTMVFTEEQEKEGLDAALLDVWSVKNNLHELTSTAADFAGIFGDFYFLVQWIPATETSEGYIKLSTIDPRYVFPEYNELTGEMEFCVVLIPFIEKKFTSKGIESKPRIHREIHYPDKTIVQQTNDDGAYDDVELLENPFNKIMVVHGINQPKAGSKFGKSDIEDILDAQALFNEKISDVSDIIDYHAAPITLIYGAKAKQLEKGANKVWSGLPPNARVENLSSEGNIPAALKFVGSIKEYMHEIANIPIDAFGLNRGISNTSAVALAITYEPMIEVAEDKRFYFAKALTQVNERIIDILCWARLLETTLPPEDLYNVQIKFGNLLPRDHSSTLNDIEVELRLGLESRKGALDRLGIADTAQKLKEIEDEKYLLAQQEAKIAEILEPTPVTSKLPQVSAEEEKAQNPIIHGEQVLQQNIEQKSPSA